MWFYVNGRFVEESEATVPVTDRSFLYGDGCFEGIGACDGRLLHLDDHVARLVRSARMIRIEMPITASRLRDLILETAARNDMATAPMGYLRPVLSRGSGPLGLRFSQRLGPATLVIIPQLGARRVAYRGPIETLTAAVSTYTVPPSSSLDPRIKSNNYLSHVMAFLDAADRGADVAIMRDAAGRVCEGHGMNVFCVRDGRLLTPPEDAGLAGITRHHVLATALGLGVPCLEASLTTYDLYTADEIFVTSSLEAVTAISSIDGQAVGASAPGPVTSAVREAYVRLALETGTEIPVFAQVNGPQKGVIR
ncbi:MAG TPA: aminotransferase class IV [Candidatus Sulfotelmatobacter sp.]|nr:aminotransferase class IV [Candidatus Sulfotelmatobacter sp.]